MSSYPPPPYGGNYHDQNNAPYPPPSYPNQYSQTENGYAASSHGNAASNYNAYGYNGAIPGINPAVVPSVAPIPIFQGWNQDAMPLPPYTAPPNAPAYTGYHSNPTPQYYPQYNPTNYQQPLSAPKKSFNQRELSEGEFDEGAIATNNPPIGHRQRQYSGNGGESYGNNTRHSTFSQSQGCGSRQSPAHAGTHNSPPAEDSLARRGSDSYSPYISPRELNNDDVKPNTFERQTSLRQNGESVIEAPKMQHGRLQNGTNSHAEATTLANSNMLKAVENVTSSTNGQQPAQYLNIANGRTTAQARKRAQDAILDIWPDVPYQTYINEGYTESYINNLFDAANIPRNSGKVPNRHSPPRSQHAPSNNLNLLQHKQPLPNDGNALMDTNGIGSSSINGSQTKSISMSTNTVMPVQSQAGMGSASTQVLPETLTTMNDKERTIQAKMEALRKSREERAQKAAAQKTGKVASAQGQAPTAPLPAATVENPHVTDEIHSATTSPAVETKVDDIQASPIHVPAISPPHSQADVLDTFTQPTSLPKHSPVNSLSHPPPPPPSIPGLFLALTAPTPPHTSGQSNMYYAAQNSRKRPVAADFDGATGPAPAKRPFGHSRADESLVIDVSEEEESDDEDVAMDLDSNQDSPVQAPRRLSDHRFSVVQSLPPISDLPRPTFKSSSSPPANTPPIPVTSSRPSPIGPAELQRKETEIQELKRRIAQAEARSKARQSSSGTRTPVSNPAARELPGNLNAVTAADNVNVAEHPKSVPDQVEIEASPPEQSITPKLSTSVPKRSITPAQQIMESIDSKSVEEDDPEVLRQEELARIEVTLRANEFENRRKKLEEMKAEIARMETEAQEAAAKLQQAKERDLRLKEEKELRLQRQKQILEENLKAGMSELSKTTQMSNTSVKANLPAIILPLPPSGPVLEDLDVIRSLSVEKANLPMRPSSAHSTRSIQLPAKGRSEAVSRSPSPVAAEQLPPPAANGLDSEVVSAEREATEPSLVAEASDTNMSNAHALEAALQEAVRAEADSHSFDEGEVEMVETDIEISHAPNPAELAPATPVAEEHSPAYSPLQRRIPPIGPAEDEEEDDYEPPEATPSPESPPFSPAPPVENDLPVFDEMMQEVVPSISDNSGRVLIDDEDNQSALPVLNGSAPVPEQVTQEVATTQYFTPYESPLRRFRAYRFHPQFKAEVAGGLRSLTYSHEIDPNAELCRYELAGGICNDNTCYCLHFKDIGYKDSLILAALGSPNQFKGPRFAAFRQGLTDVLNELRVKKIRDFDVIASEILAYRAKFLGDESKILPLEGVTI